MYGDILCNSTTEAYAAVMAGDNAPRFYLTAAEAERLYNACQAAHIGGKLMQKVGTMLYFASAKSHHAGRECVVRLE